MKTYCIMRRFSSDKMHRSRFNIIINYHVWTINPFFAIIWDRFPLFSNQYRWIDWNLIEIHRDWHSSRFIEIEIDANSRDANSIPVTRNCCAFRFCTTIHFRFYHIKINICICCGCYCPVERSFLSNPFDRSKIICSLPYYSGTTESSTFISSKQQQKNTFF